MSLLIWHWNSRRPWQLEKALKGGDAKMITNDQLIMDGSR